MLNIINNLKPFFEDTYREISVREYAKEINISPPTASKTLKKLEKEQILKKREFKKNHLFRANKESDIFGDLARIYWKSLLREKLRSLHEEVLLKKIILFGSIAKAENTHKSDLDLFINMSRKKINTEKINLNREIELHFREELKNKDLKSNINEGIIIFS
ncbi:nucleotidyltransferase domain-containing protein [Candidatus Woesearchaeota archaeon]|nr:nucleotidyltransferase domain-containing protein [Candidatus Woesearchaeota archaeon]